MNIFLLSSNMQRCAHYHCDRHIVKMPIEITQMVCTVLHELGYAAPYKTVHPHHPQTLWVGESFENFSWAVNFGLALCEEYTYRYDRIHACEMILRRVARYEYVRLDRKGKITRHPQTMPDEYRVSGNPVAGYRNYYIGEKLHFAWWTGREIPYWVRNHFC